MNSCEVFWKWFSENTNYLNQFEPGREDILNSISENLAVYNPSLAYEIGQPINGVREFIISAEGVVDEFNSVQMLAESAPKLQGWNIIPFRPRMDLKYTVQYGSIELNPADLWIYHRVENGYFDLIVYYSNYNEEIRNEYVEGCYILLDMAIGEFYVATGIRYIDHQLLSENPNEIGLKPFVNLPEIFDQYINSQC